MEKPAKWWHITSANLLTDIAAWLILLLPLLVYPKIYEPFGFGRYAMFMYFLVILLLGIVLARLRSHLAWWKLPLFWLTIIWWLVAILSAATGVNPARSWWGTVTRGEGLFFLTGLIILGIGLLVMIRREAGWLKIFSIMTWVGALSGLYALLQPLNLPLMLPLEKGARAFGLMGNPIFLGQLLLLTIFFTLYFISATTGKLRWTYLLSLLLQVAGIAVTVSRGPLVGLAAGGLVWLIGWFILYGWGKIRKYWLWMMGGLLVVTAAAGALLYLRYDQFQRLFVLGDTFRARLGIWSTAWQAIKARPWLGYGTENARYGLAHFYQSGLADISLGETTTDRAHNLILDQLITNGWVGLTIMIIIVVWLLWALWRRFYIARRQDNLALAMLVWSLISTAAAYLVAMMFVFDVVPTSIYVTIIMAGSIFLISAELKEPVKLPSVFPFLAWLALIGLVFLDARYLLPAWRIGQYVESATVLQARNNYRDANLQYIKAQEPINPYRWPYLTVYPPFARQYASLLIEQKKDLIGANSIVSDGLRVLGNIRRNEPDRVGLFIEYPLLYAVQSYTDPRYASNVRSSFDELVKEFPNHEYLYTREAQALIGIGQYDEAKQLLDQAAKFKSVPPEVWFWRAFVRIRTNDRDQKAIIDDLQQSVAANRTFTNDPSVIRPIVSYLVQARQWQLAAFFQEKLVAMLPQDLTEHSNLLTIYKEGGRLDDVVKIAREIVALDSTKYAEVQKFLQSVGRSL